MGCCSDFVDIGCVNYCASIDTTYDATQTGTHTIEISTGSDTWNVYNVSFTSGDDLVVIGSLYVNEQGVHFLRIKQPDDTYYAFSTGVTCLKFTTEIHYGQDNPAITPPTLCYTDCDAVHVDESGEISAITEKVSPVNGDWIIIEDSADSDSKKKVQIGNLPTSGAGEANTASNVGTQGIGLFKQKTGVDLEFKNIAAQSSAITVTDFPAFNAVAIDIDAAQIDATTLDNLPCIIQIACSDLTTALTTGNTKAYFRIPKAFTLTDVRASVLTAPTGALLQVDINQNGGSLLSTKITIDIGEKSSVTAATPPVLLGTAIVDDGEITIDIDQVGSTIAGAGLIVTMIGVY